MATSDLEGIGLTRAAFADANLSQALLTGSRMPEANFRKARLRAAGLAEVIKCGFIVDPTILDLLRLQGVGPKTVATLYRDLNVRSLDDLEKACIDGRIRSMKGMGAKKEALILKALDERKRALDRPAATVGGLDVTLPGTAPALGRRHPLTQTILEFKDIMGRFGFTVADGPEIEDEYHNFEALNIPPDHPARDPLDNFYLAAAGVAAESGPRLLRSQTSTVQIRVMEQTRPPVRIISVGRVYRPDTIDATHSCMFHQMEGLMVGDAVTMAELKTVLRLFARAYLGHDVHIRFRPSFFPFTEPSVEVDMSWNEPGKSWLEIGGAGMVDPHVLAAVGYDPDKVSGFAFGLGVERFCMRRYGIRDIRLFTANDLQFLRQF
jgi:phenylalanyl-tRNA synthetase alpha chain